MIESNFPVEDVSVLIVAVRVPSIVLDCSDCHPYG